MFSKTSLISLFLEERDRWFLWLPVFMGLGVGLYFSWPFEPPLWVCAAFFCAAAVLAGKYYHHPLMPACLAVAVFCLGHFAAKIETDLIAQPMLQEAVEKAEVTGRVMVINHLPEGYRLWLEDAQVIGLLKKDTPRKLRIKVKMQRETPQPGDWVNLNASLYPLSRPSEPGAFNFRRYAFFQGYGATGYALAPWQKADGPPPGLMQSIALFFERVRVTINEKLFAPGKDRNTAVASALITGDQSSIDKNTMQAMRVSGISHILSVSGLHITLVAGIVFYTLRALMALFPWVALHWPIKKIAAFAALLAALFYTFMCSAPIPAVRSMLMSGLVLIAIMVDRRALSMRLVGFAALVSLLLSPTALFDPSFQLSFGAVMALIAVFEKHEIAWLKYFREGGWLGKLRLYLLGSIATSLIASAATAPFILFYFQQVNWYGVLTNLIAVPLSSFIIMPAAVAAALAMPFQLEHWPMVIMNTGIQWMLESAEFVAALPGSVSYHPAMPFYALLLFTFGGLWMCLWRRRWRYLGAIPFILGTLAFLITPRPDVFIADDGVTVGVRLEDGRLAVRAKDMEDFTVQNWLQRDGKYREDRTQLVNWFDIIEKGGQERLTCKENDCVYTLNGKRIAFPFNDKNWDSWCQSADVIIPAFNGKTCEGKIVLSPITIRQKGAQVIYTQQRGLKIETAEDSSSRPWNSN